VTALGVVALICASAVGCLWMWLRWRQWDAAEARRHESAVYEAQAVRMAKSTEDELRQALAAAEARISRLEMAKGLGR
jgi:hypothetical protein